MADITLIANPFGAGPNPVENCLQHCFSIANVVDPPASNAVFCLTFFEGAPPASEDDEVTLAGVDVTIGTDPGELDLTGIDMFINAINFIAWIESTYPFIGNVAISSVVTVGVDYTVCVNWLMPGAQPNWDFDPGSLTLTEMNGANAVGLLGFDFLYQLMCFDPDTFLIESLCPIQTSDVPFDETGQVNNFCIDVHWDLSNQVSTTVPDCDAVLVEDLTISKWVCIIFGFSQIDTETGCGSQFGTFQHGPAFQIINQAINPHNGEFGEQDFRFSNIFGGVNWLTTRSFEREVVCMESYDWLWFVGSYDNFTGGDLNSYQYSIVFFDALDNTLSIEIGNVNQDGIYIMPTGPANITNLGFAIPAGACRYTIQINVVKNSPPFFMPYTPFFNYYIEENCCCSEAIYFLDPLGGYTPVWFKCVETVDARDKQDEICLDVQCPSFNDELFTGRSQINSQTYTRITLQTTKLKKTEDNLCRLRAFKASEKKFELFTDKTGETNPRRVIVEPGSLRIYEREGLLQLTITVIESQPLRVISEN